MPTRIVEWQIPYSWGTGIGIDTNKVISVLLREENNLIQVNGDNELYTDLQLVSNIKPTDDFPVGVTTWKILQSDWWTQSGLLLNWKTTSGDYARWIYANDWKIYFDNGTGTWKQVYYSSEVDNLIQTLRNYVDATYQPKLTAWTWITIDQNNVISSTWWGWWGTWDVTWPNWAVDWNLAVFDWISGKYIKDGWPIPTPTTVVDALDSTSTTSALSANQGRILDWKIADMMGLGKFLSLWNSTTGQPISFPLSTPYTYTTWDYFIIEVTGTTNYKPNGSSYTGTASSTTESEEIEVWDVYVYDWQAWLLQSNHGKTVTFANIAGLPSDNTALDNALDAKQDALTAWTNISITNNTISADGLTILSYGSSTWNDFITAYNRWWIVYCRASSNSNPASWTQGRMAFMAYLNNPTAPTEVEFQYYRSMTSHSASQQGDQVFVYKLTNASWWTWTVTTREASSKIATSTGLTSSYSNGTLTLSNTWVTSVNSGTWAVTVNDIKVASSAPSTPSEWMAWYDSTNDVLKIYDGSNWTAVWGGGWVKVYDCDDLRSNWVQDLVTEFANGTLCVIQDNNATRASFWHFDQWTMWIVAYAGWWNIKAYNIAQDTNSIRCAKLFEAPYNTSTYVLWTITLTSLWFFAPWWTATTGYVVTKTASGYEWAAPSGWDVMVSSQSWNILTSWMKIWAWTESDYSNLGTYDSNTVYLTV